MEKVSIVECESYNQKEVDNAVRKALLDIQFEFKFGSKVLIKPNLLTSATPKQAITTHPAIVEAVCKLLKTKKCKITIAESTGFFTQEKHLLFGKTGMEDIAKKYGAELLLLEKVAPLTHKAKYQSMDIELPNLFDKYNLIINIPKLKTHMLAQYTGAMKNLYGFVPGCLKQKYHSVGRSSIRFHQILLDIYNIIQPQINIMDGVMGLEGDGPGTGGVPKKAGMIIASRNGAALDCVASESMGFKLDNIPLLRLAKGHHLIPEYEIIGKKKVVNFKKPMVHKGKILTAIYHTIFAGDIADPYVIEEKCTRCGTCARVCPVKCITLKPYPEWDYKKCIHCYCCHENCPYKAIGLRKSFLGKMGLKLKVMYDKIMNKLNKRKK